MIINQGFPQQQGDPAGTPLLDENGYLSLPWQQFFVSLWARTGGALGAQRVGAGTASIPITANTSPFVFKPPSSGSLFVSGGGVSSMTISRGGKTIAVGQFYGSLYMAETDTVNITYVRLPQITFFPI